MESKLVISRSSNSLIFALLVSFSIFVEADAIIFSASASALDDASVTICEALLLAFSSIFSASAFDSFSSF